MAKVTVRRRTDNVRAVGRAPLYAVLYIDKNKIRIPLDIAVADNEWDALSERVKGRSKEVRDLNLIISNTKARISDILVRARLTGERLTRDSFLEYYRHPGESELFVAYARARLDKLREVLQPSTRQHHLAVLQKIEDYSPALKIRDITTEWLRIYAAYLRDAHGNNPGTIDKNIGVIRSHYFAAMREGKIRVNPFEAYRGPKPDPAIVYLTEQELDSMIRLFRSGHLDANETDALRFFLFMFFTGMHISDARALQLSQIVDGEIHYRRVKTGVRVAVPLSQPAMKLVEFYRGGRLRGDLFTSLPTDQAFNRLIKRVSAKAGIAKPVSAKTARHTFATIYYKRNNGDLGTLSKLLGHARISTTMIYAHIMKDTRREGVSAFDGML